LAQAILAQACQCCMWLRRSRLQSVSLAVALGLRHITWRQGQVGPSACSFAVRRLPSYINRSGKPTSMACAAGETEGEQPAADAATCSPARAFQIDRDYRIVASESGSMRNDIPIFATEPGAVHLDDSSKPAVSREECPDIPGAFVLHDVCTPAECEQIIAASESMGYTEDAPVSLGRNIRQNENCVWIADGPLNEVLFKRCEALLPSVGESRPVGLNARWRLYKYNHNDIFRMHTDGAWPGSGIHPKSGRLVGDLYGDRFSKLTWVLYLNDDFEGGETRFFRPEGPRHVSVQGDIPARRGSVLCFFHGTHHLSPLHEGALVKNGTKYIVRSDVLYMNPSGPARN